MTIRTTCIGAYPKPDYIEIGNFAESDEQEEGVTRAFTYTQDNASQVPEELLIRATRAAIEDQLACGIDIPTDGEQRRENYIHYHCRNLEGIDFVNLTNKVHRNGAAVADLPTVRARVEPRGGHFLDRDYRVAQQFSDRPVKLTVPGPLSIIDTTANVYYPSERNLAFDLADSLNYEIRALAEAGCKYIQVDEPLFVRKVDDALDYGIECLDRCFDGVPADVTRVMHMCCGYPGHIDDEDYLKADPDRYFELARAVDQSSVDQVSIEDAHCLNELSLLENFRRSAVILGVVTIASSRIETSEYIQQRLELALRHIDAERLLAAPDCGLMMLGRELAMAKLDNMCRAAHSIVQS
ncbi:MAG: cobalamin-independent methionine synthase II family protein [Gammaproteobacteria bacterium]|nr:MAG: 5-methyltetrahydropteroyltriglutamate--homocysteine methyltransferase [Gammaproteobacteria bacterium]UCH40323.1 MAG: cobalamin-independent methionine synthase II family protein [Gammaproteobacteria bacterium]